MSSNASRHARTKIIATIGPANQTAKAIKALHMAGVDLFRLNFSHGSVETHKKTVEIIRKLEKQTGNLIGIIADMQGPKLRIGHFEKGAIALKKNQAFRFDLDDKKGDQTRVKLPHPEILKVLKKDQHIFLDDGKVRARITKKGKDYIETIIETGTALSDNKGFNIPNIILPVPALTEKDKKDLRAALDMGVDWIAQSFVQTVEDVKQARKLIKNRAKLMVKLEKPAALNDLKNIASWADGIMIARGDLGVEIPPEQVPAAQKRIIRHMRSIGKPVVVATQMLESMVTSPRPTRAEASDVANAVYDGADAVMLSAETAVGDYAERAVEIMNRICKTTESDETYHDMMQASHPETLDDNDADAITAAAYYVSQDIDAKAIVTYTTSGSTALRMARQRPEIPVLCLTPDINVARQLQLSYAVQAEHVPEIKGDFTGPAAHASRILRKNRLAKKGDKFVMTAGVPFGTPGSTNILRIAEVE